jgi:hypothetical protein
MEERSRSSKWMWLVPVVFIVFLVLSLTQGAILAALGWLGLLVNGLIVASGLHTRSRALSYLSLGFAVLGVLFLVVSIVRSYS